MNIRDELAAYAERIITGQEISCTKHKQACARFLCDLAREGTADFPYVFDESKAARFYDWAALFKHRRGVLAGQFVALAPIVRFITGNVYGWRHSVTGYRRFTKMYWQVARKNMKSQLLAIMGLYELAAFNEVGDEVQEVYCAATKREQARIVYDEAVALVKASPLLKKKFKKAYGRLVHLRTESVMRALSEEDRKTGDGLNPQCGIIDEYHAHETSEAYDVIDSGMGARAQPLLAIITTAGFNLEHPCYRIEYKLIERILDPGSPDTLESYFAMVNELEVNTTSETMEIDGRKIAPGEIVDDKTDPLMWAKANPIVCSYPEGCAYLAKKAEEAALSPEKQRNFLTKHLNCWVNQRECGYMNLGLWAACAGEIPSLDGEVCWVGLDLSAKSDLTSVAFEFRLDNRYYVLTHSFIPEDKLGGGTETDLVPYALWARDGWLTVIPGPVIDYRVVMEYVHERAKAKGWYIDEWCIDPWGGYQLAGDLTDQGDTVVEIVQGTRTLSEPTKDFRNMVKERRVIHDGSPVTAWAMGNAVADVTDRNMNIILNKRKSRQRIDPVAAIINAHVRAMIAETEEPRAILL